jgi:hypothetical protein
MHPVEDLGLVADCPSTPRTALPLPRSVFAVRNNPEMITVVSIGVWKTVFTRPMPIVGVKDHKLTGTG